MIPVVAHPAVPVAMTMIPVQVGPAGTATRMRAAVVPVPVGMSWMIGVARPVVPVVMTTIPVVCAPVAMTTIPVVLVPAAMTMIRVACAPAAMTMIPVQVGHGAMTMISVRVRVPAVMTWMNAVTLPVARAARKSTNRRWHQRPALVETNMMIHAGGRAPAAMN
jgi:hypothetical protein